MGFFSGHKYFLCLPYNAKPTKFRKHKTSLCCTPEQMVLLLQSWLFLTIINHSTLWFLSSAVHGSRWSTKGRGALEGLLEEQMRHCWENYSTSKSLLFKLLHALGSCGQIHSLLELLGCRYTVLSLAHSGASSVHSRKVDACYYCTVIWAFPLDGYHNQTL